MRTAVNNLLLWLADLTRFHRLLSVFALGLLTGLSMPPIDAWWILGITFPAFILALDSGGDTKRRESFYLGWMFGFGYFLAVLHWIAFAFLVDADAFLWMMPFAVCGLAALLALFWALAAAVGHRFVVHGTPAILVYPLSFTIFEWLRGHILTGFPWAVPGLAADGMGGVLQLASVVGMNGLTLMILLWALVPLGLCQTDQRQRSVAILIGISLPLAWAWGEWRVASFVPEFLDGPVVRLVQPNIAQSDKWRGDNARAIFDQLLQLSAQPAKGAEPTVIVWPESAVPFLIDESEEGKNELRKILLDRKILLTGAVRRTSADAAVANYFTSILAFDGQAKVVATYDKHHLVPGGEYLPLAWLIEPLGFRKIVNLPESFSSGAGPTDVEVPGLGLIAMQICYEDIFLATIPSRGKRPDWLLNVTNDGWFGNSAGPRQHLAQLRMRAVEQGLGTVRVANTGISAVIDTTGGYVLQSEMDQIAVLDSRVPKSLASTVFSMWGEFVFVLLVCVCLTATIILRRPLEKVEA